MASQPRYCFPLRCSYEKAPEAAVSTGLPVRTPIIVLTKLLDGDKDSIRDRWWPQRPKQAGRQQGQRAYRVHACMQVQRRRYTRARPQAAHRGGGGRGGGRRAGGVREPGRPPLLVVRGVDEHAAHLSV